MKAPCSGSQVRALLPIYPFKCFVSSAVVVVQGARAVDSPFYHRCSICAVKQRVVSTLLTKLDYRGCRRPE